MDYLVNLVNMFEDTDSPYLTPVREMENGIVIKRPHTFEKRHLMSFIAKNFSENWCDETEPAFSHIPCKCFVALDSEKNIIGFASYDVLRRGMFGPIGTCEKARKKGVGGALLTECLRGLYNMGFPYAFIGSMNPDAYNFYNHYVGKYMTPIPDSVPGVYRDRIKDS